MTFEVPQTIDTILWDLDGTLIDSFGIYKDVLGGILPDLGRRMPSDDTLQMNFHGSLPESISSALGGVEPDELARIVEAFLAVQNDHYEVIDHHLLRDAVRLARASHTAGLTQVIVTNREHAGRQLASPRSIVERTELKNYIDEIVCGDDAEQRKPNPAVLDGLRSRRKISGDRTIVIGDQVVDAELARNIGASCVLVSRDGMAPPHMERLGGWESSITIVATLDDVILTQKEKQAYASR